MSEQKKNKLSSKELTITLLVILITIQGVFFSDLYVPALPEIAAALHTTRSLTELSITIYFSGFAIAQWFYGPISERYGRRKIVLLGMFIAVIGSIIILLSNTVAIFLIGRFIQAVGMAAPMSLGRIIMKDIFLDNIKYARMTSYVGAGMLIAPAIAPITGGYIQITWSWYADFIFIQALILINLLVIYFWLPETLTVEKRTKVTLKSAILDYWFIIQNTTFLAYVFCSGCALAGMISYVTVSSFLFEKFFHFTVAEYSWLSIFTSMALILSMLVNTRLLTKFGINKQIRNGLYLMLFSSLLLFIFIMTHNVNPINVIISIVIFYFGGGFVFINASAGSFAPFEGKVGFVGSMYSVLRFMMTVLVGSIVSLSAASPIYVTVTTFFVLSLLGYLIYHKKLAKLKKQI